MNNIFLTGRTSFIGKNLLPKLKDEGYDVHYLVKQSSENAKLFSDDKHAQLGDLLNYDSLYRSICEVKPDIIIHLAALTPVRLSWLEPIKYQMVNYLGTVNLLEACINQLQKPFWFIYASSAEVYGNQFHKMPLKEDYSPLNPISPYAVSKANAEAYLKMRKLSTDFDLTILRPNNTYGRKNSGYFVESMIEQMLYPKGNQTCTYSTSDVSLVTLYNATHIRDYLHIDDHVSAYLHILKNKLEGTFNVAQGEPISNYDMVVLMAKTLNTPVLIETRGPDLPRPCDQEAIVQDCSKIRATGWKPKFSRVEGITKLRGMYN
mgnify:CR=1 FL=1